MENNIPRQQKMPVSTVPSFKEDLCQREETKISSTEELRNTDFVQFTAKPIEILTWAVYPDPEQRLSPSVLAVNAYAAISRYETRKINRDCKRNGINLRLQVLSVQEGGM